MQIAMARRARHDNLHCGDACGFWQGGSTITLCVVDGLGSGEFAERAAQAAMQYVAAHPGAPLQEMFAGCNVAIRHTRGVAMGLAVIDAEAGTLTYAGIGNTRILIVGTRSVRLPSRYGIVGAGDTRVAPVTVPLRPGELVLLFTDGLVRDLDMSGYDDTLRADLPRLAEKILQDWRRREDDAAVLLYRGETG